MEDIVDPPLQPTLFSHEPHFPLPFVSPDGAHIMEHYPLLNGLFDVILRYLDCVVDNLLDWESQLMAVAFDMQEEAAHAVEALGIIRLHLSIFLSGVYKAVERSVTHPHPYGVLPSETILLCSFDDIFSAFEASVQVSPVTSFALAGVTSFLKIPIGSKWLTHEVGTRLYSLLIDRNGDILCTYLSAMISRYEMPKIESKKWVYASGAIGVSIFAIWLLSKYADKADTNEVSYQEAFANFWSDHVKNPLASIREAIFKRVTESDGGQKKVIEATDTYLWMVKGYSGETPVLDDHKTSELVNIRLKQDFDHPIRGVFNGGFFQGIMIRVQRLFVDYEMGRNWIGGFLRINKKTLAFIAALPAIILGGFLLCGVSIGSLAMFYFAKESERKAMQTMLADLERSVTEHTRHRAEEGQEGYQGCYLHGILLLDLDKFYRKVASRSRSREEWLSLERDLKYLGKSRIDREEEVLVIVDRLKRRVS